MRSGRALSGARAVALLAAACLLPASVTAQGAAGAPTGAPPAQSMAATDLEPLVARIALYPDDLLAIMLPAATTPLDLVKGQRFLDKRTSDPNLKPDANLAEPVRNLLNYPEIVKSMTDDLDWTVALGEAVTNQQQGLIAAIQAFRRKAQAAGNLKTDDKQSVVQQAEVIQILPANPEVIYVPQYQPSVVIVQQPAPVVTYAPTPYPVYYYPYPPGAALATGLIVGAATAYAFSWTNHAIHHGYDVHELQEERMDYARESREDWQSHQKGMQDDRQQATADRQGQRQDAVSDGQGQRPQPQPTQTSAQQPRTQQTQTQRQGSAAPTQQAQQPRTSAAPTSSQAQQPRAQGAQAGGQTWQPQQTGGGQVNRGQAQSTQYSRPGESSFGGGGAGSGGAFGGVGSGSQSSFQSQRGSYSRSGGGYSGGGGGRRR